MPDFTNHSKQNTDKLRALANQKLHYTVQIAPDDPILTVLVLNDVLFSIYLEKLELALIEAQAKQNSATQNYMDEVKRSFDDKLKWAAGYLKDEIEQVIVDGKTSIKNIAQYEKTMIQQLTQLNFMGSACWFLSGAGMVGIIMIKIWFGEH